MLLFLLNCHQCIRPLTCNQNLYGLPKIFCIIKGFVIFIRAAAADQTCQQWVEKLLEGRGVPFLKAQHKQLLASDSQRAKLLLLVERGLLGRKEAMETLQNISPMVIMQLNVLLKLF